MHSYVSRLHLVGIVTLAALTTGLALFGWALRPSSGGFDTVPGGLQLYIPTAPPGLAYVETMTNKGGGSAVLTIEGLPQITDVVPTQSFTLAVNNLGSGRLCTPPTLTNSEIGTAIRLQHQHVTPGADLGFTTPGTYHLRTIHGRGYFYVRLCWSSDGPTALHGAYLSARFPPVEVFYATKDDQNVTRRLNLGSPDAADYVIQSLQPPTSVTDGGWQWAPRISPGRALNFTAVNTSETQHDTYQAFLSGILFGVAGGALVALIQEFVAPFRARKELRPPEPGG